MQRIPILDYAELSQDVYNSKAKRLTPLLKNHYWIREKETNYHSNFFARLYVRKNKEGKVVAAVVAFRGTMPYEHPYNDLSDFKMAVLHELPLSYKPARTFFHKARWYIRDNYPGVTVKLTGHSLGGTLAQLIAAKNGQTAVIFNSPGIGELPGIHTEKNYQRNIHNINAKEGYINKLGKVIGSVQTIEVSEGEEDLSKASKIEHDHLDLLLGLSGVLVKDGDIADEKVKGYYQQHIIKNMIDALKHHRLSSPPYAY